MDLYFRSVGRGAVLLLNLPPDRRGRIHENEVNSLREFRKTLNQIFSRDLAQTAKASASNVRGNDQRYAPKNLTDPRRETYWATDDAVTNAEIVLSWSNPVTFNVARLREYLPLGQRVEAFSLDQWKDAHCEEFASGTSIGNCRLVIFPPITTPKVRLRIIKSPVCPALSEFGLFAENHE